MLVETVAFLPPPAALRPPLAGLRSPRGTARPRSAACPARCIAAPRAQAAAEPGSEALLAANTAFYDAMRDQSHARMMDLWLPSSDDVSVAHPLHGLVVGGAEVASAWAGMFALGKVLSLDVEVVRTEVGRNVGWLLCRQRVQGMRGRETVGGERVATNIFHVYKGEWKMAHHSAAPVVMMEDEDDADASSDGQAGSSGPGEDGTSGSGGDGPGVA